MNGERKIRDVRDVFGAEKESRHKLQQQDDHAQQEMPRPPKRQAPPPPPAKVAEYECGGDLLANSLSGDSGLSMYSSDNDVPPVSSLNKPTTQIAEEDEGLDFSEDEMTMDFGSEDFKPTTAAQDTVYKEYEGEDYSKFLSDDDDDDLASGQGQDYDTRSMSSSNSNFSFGSRYSTMTRHSDKPMFGRHADKLHKIEYSSTKMGDSDGEDSRENGKSKGSKKPESTVELHRHLHQQTVSNFSSVSNAFMLRNEWSSNDKNSDDKSLKQSEDASCDREFSDFESNRKDLMFASGHSNNTTRNPLHISSMLDEYG